MKSILILTSTFVLTFCFVPQYRLDTTNLNVKNYDIRIVNIDEDSHSFMGAVDIQIDLNGTDIQIHKQNLKLISVTLDSVNCEIKSEDDNDTQITILSCPNEKSEGQVLSISYTGKISTEDMEGFYLSKYEDNGENKTLMVTQLEPIYARRFFPCFDEPELKATFQLSVEHDKKYKAISNTKEATTRYLREKDNTETVFEKTPLMSTYGLALILSEFESENVPDILTTIRFWFRPEARKYIGTASSYASKLLMKLGDYCDRVYPYLGINKTDFVAIPDFVGDDMENWALLTFRESDFLDEAENTTALGKQRIVTSMAHELVHQWFGDYATPEWWSDTWLNEGFATYLQYHIPSHNEKEDEMDLYNQFLIDILHPAMIADSVSTVEALISKEDDVNSVAQIDGKFDDISYYKGASILRMMATVKNDLVMEGFIRGLLQTHKYTPLVVSHENFFDALGEDYTNQYRKWFEQPGYPLVTASRVDDKLILQQKHYTTGEGDLTWNIPIILSTSVHSSIATQWITEVNNNLTLDEGTDWVIVNWRQGSYYRVKYEDSMFNAILNILKTDPERVHPLNRAQIIDDTFNLAVTGETTYKQAFSLTDYLFNETDYNPWAATINVITDLVNKIDDDFITSSIQERLLQVMEGVIKIPDNHTDLPFDSHIETIKGITILKAACAFGHSDCLKFAQNVHDAYLEDKNINNNYRSLGLCSTLKNSGKQQEDWNKLFEAFVEAETSHEKDDLLLALGCASDKTVLQDYLQKSIDASSGIRRQDTKNVFKAVLKGGRTGVSVALDFMVKNLDEIQKYYKEAVPEMVTGIAKLLVNEADVKKLKDFIEANKEKIPEIQVVADKTLEVVDRNLKWSTEKLVDLQKLFPKPTPKPQAANTISFTLGLLVVAVLVVFKV